MRCIATCLGGSQCTFGSVRFKSLFLLPRNSMPVKWTCLERSSSSSSSSSSRNISPLDSRRAAWSFDQMSPLVCGSSLYTDAAASTGAAIE